jgi:acyl-coenzyme A thioesterase PaaI-like protein
MVVDDHRLQVLNDADGFNARTGIVLIEWTDGFGSVRVDLAPYHVNPMHVVHGALYTAMLDVSLAMTGSFRPAPDPLLPGLTLSLTTQFLSIATLDDRYLIAEAHRTGGGRSVFFADGVVRAPSGRTIASASGLFKPSRSSQ